MGYPEFHYEWEWWLRSSPERLWPFVADTNRFNRDTGLPGGAAEPTTQSEKTPARACCSRNSGYESNGRRNLLNGCAPIVLACIDGTAPDPSHRRVC